MTAAKQLEQLRSALAGRYAVERVLGRGGMATVYAAEDLRHRRRVAVKVLDPELGAALGAERFLREIQVTANLHHPHILPLHDSGEAALAGESGEAAGRLLYYVMPLVEGESLRERLARERQLPVDEAVRIGVQAAGALDYAHRRGFVHRDLKPENVLLQDGEALVADFGIARAISRAADADTLTGTGVTVGTPHYMSPEQAAGERELDARTDIYSLGCVLYEMLAGSPPFTAPTAQGVIAKVLAEEPRPLSGERRAVPPHVGAAVMRALEKLPADRFATAAQFAAAITAPAGVTQPAGAAFVAAPARPRRAVRLTPRGVATAALSAALGAVLAVLGLRATAPGGERMRLPPATSVRFTLTTTDSQRLAGSPRPVAISPDGRTVVYVGEAGPGRRVLYLRPLNEFGARRIAGTEGAVAPFFSPDGRWIAFHDNRSLKKVPVGGGNVVTLAEFPGAAGLAWGPNDVIVAGSARGLSRVPAAGGTPERLTAVDAARGQQAHTAPVFLPDGKTVAFRISLSGGTFPSRLGLVSADARPSADGRAAPYTTLDVRGGTPLGYADGMLIVGRPDGTVAAVPVDLRRGRVSGEPVLVLDQVVWNGGASASLADDGSLVYVRGSGTSRLAFVDERGTVVRRLGEPQRYRYPRFSPDGRRIAVEIPSGEATGGDIWVFDLPSGVLSRLTSRTGATRPEWTPDGKRVAYIVEGGERPSEVWWAPADKSGPEERLHAMPGEGMGIREVTFSPDGRHAVLRVGTGGPTTNDLWLLPLDSAAGAAGRRAAPVVQTPFSEAMPCVSPDGRWLAYASDETGQYEVYIRPFRGPGGPVQVSDGGGAEPVWAPGGRRLVYRTGDRFLAASLMLPPATAAGGLGLSVADRRMLFEGRYLSALPIIAPPQYDVHPDRREFVVVQALSEDREIVVVLNWLAEVRARTSARARQ